MTLDNWAALAEIIGALAIIITLLYLAIQMRQTTTSTQAAAYQGWLAVHDNVFSFFEDQHLCKIINKGMLDARNLNEDDYSQFIAWMRRYLYLQQSQFDLYRQGVIDKELWDCNLNDMIGVFRFPGVQQYWEAGAREHFKKDFVRAIEEAESFSPILQWNSEQGFFKTEYHKE